MKLTEIQLDAIRALMSAREAKRAAENAENAAREIVRALFPVNDPVLTWRNVPVARLACTTRCTISSKLVRALYPEIVPNVEEINSVERIEILL